MEEKAVKIVDNGSEKGDSGAGDTSMRQEVVMEKAVQEEEVEKELMGAAGEEKGHVAAAPGCSPWPFPPSIIMATQIFVMSQKKVCISQRLFKATRDYERGSRLATSRSTLKGKECALPTFPLGGEKSSWTTWMRRHPRE